MSRAGFFRTPQNSGADACLGSTVQTYSSTVSGQAEQSCSALGTAPYANTQWVFSTMFLPQKLIQCSPGTEVPQPWDLSVLETYRARTHSFEILIENSWRRAQALAFPKDPAAGHAAPGEPPSENQSSRDIRAAESTSLAWDLTGFPCRVLYLRSFELKPGRWGFTFLSTNTE